MIRTDDQNVWLQPDRPELLDRMLGRFGLGFSRCCNEWHQRKVDQNRAFRTEFKTDLPSRFEKRLRLNIPNGTAYFNNSDIAVFCAIIYSSFDFIGNVGNHLDRCT